MLTLVLSCLSAYLMLAKQYYAVRGRIAFRVDSSKKKAFEKRTWYKFNIFKEELRHQFINPQGLARLRAFCASLELPSAS